MNERCSGLEKAVGILYLCISIVGALATLFIFIDILYSGIVVLNVVFGCFLGAVYGVSIWFSTRMLRPFDPRNPLEKRSFTISILVFSCICPYLSLIISAFLIMLSQTPEFLIFPIMLFALLFYACIASIVITAILLSRYSKLGKEMLEAQRYYGQKGTPPYGYGPSERDYYANYDANSWWYGQNPQYGASYGPNDGAAQGRGTTATDAEDGRNSGYENNDEKNQGR